MRHFEYVSANICVMVCTKPDRLRTDATPATWRI